MIDIDNKILQAEYDRSIEIKIPLNNEEKGKWKTTKKAYAECVQKHLVNQQKSIRYHHRSMHLTSSRQDA